MLRVAKKEIEKITVFGNDYPTPDGTCIRDYIHIEDLAQAHLASFEYLLAQQEENQEEKSDFSLFEVFNIGTGIGKSVQEMIALVQNIIGEEIQVEMWERRDGDVAVSVANPTKAKQLLSREAQRSIMQAIQDARNYYSQQ